jgi:phosphoribosyl-dephospho-CoA transferase
MAWGAHDLLQISDFSDLTGSGQCPSWVERSLEQAPFVVVRRAESRQGMVPAGVRGTLRRHRFAGYISCDSAIKRIVPERLVRTADRLDNVRAHKIPALNALSLIIKKLAGFPLAYGPTGSVGFELASGRPVVTVTSDLDLLFRVPERLPLRLARELAAILAESACRIDAQLETPHGGVSLGEYVRSDPPLLLRRNSGPILVSDPWSMENSQ